MGRSLRRRIVVLFATEVCLLVGMLHAFVLDLGGWRHLHRAGVLEALTQYLMRPPEAMLDPSAQATQQAWHSVYLMAGIFLAMVVVGLLLKQACAEWQQYRDYQQLEEWQRS
ncbi:hypothetical protein LLH23_03390 [bacterium]|nr:hypothetical protein [bacterium]